MRKKRILAICFIVVPFWICAIYWFAVSRGGTAKVVAEYVASVRAGKTPALSSVDAESEEAIAALRTSHDLSTSNWERSSNYACVWASVTTPTSEVDVNFLLVEVDERLQVSRLSTKDRCKCGGRYDPCRWEPGEK